MLAGIDLAQCPLDVPTSVMEHVVRVESSFNPYAIGVVGARLVRQPHNLAEAVATAQELERQGYNFSLGLAQVNRYNLAKYGLGTYTDAFGTCANLQAGARILAECHGRSGGDWGKSFSCYYSGNFVTGYRHGYVDKIFASMRSQSNSDAQTLPIPLIDNAAATIGGTRLQPEAGRFTKRTQSMTEQIVSADPAFVGPDAQQQAPKSPPVSAATVKSPPGHRNVARHEAREKKNLDDGASPVVLQSSSPTRVLAANHPVSTIAEASAGQDKAAQSSLPPHPPPAVDGAFVF